MTHVAVSSSGHHDVAVIGGGLSGLVTCYLLNKRGTDAHIFEASNRLGGRIDSIRDPMTGAALGDLGPTWVWPDFQPMAAKWLSHLNIETYDQYQSGKAVLDLSPDTSPQHQYMPQQQGSTRIIGGPQTLITRLENFLPKEKTHLNSSVQAIQSDGDMLRIEVTATNGPSSLTCNKLVIAAPLRVMAETINWSGLLDQNTVQIMQEAPTWMSTQAKATVIYKHPFWRSRQLSGGVFSRVGPLVEIHDHSGIDGSPAALFGFVGRPPGERNPQHLKEATIAQLVRCFGQEAKQFEQFEIKDWALENLICSKRDLETPPTHPVMLDPAIHQTHFNGRIMFATAETAQQSPGLIEGAFDAAERAAYQCQAGGLEAS